MAEHTLTVKTTTVSYNAPRRKRPRCDAPYIARGVVLSEMRKRDTDTEHFFLLTQNACHEMTGFKCLHTGTSTQSPVDVRKLFQTVLKCGAAGFIVAHNHPTNRDPEPSVYDISMTRTLVKGAALLGLNMNDHIIATADGRTYSFRDSKPEIFEQ